MHGAVACGEGGWGERNSKGEKKLLPVIDMVIDWVLASIFKISQLCTFV